MNPDKRQALEAAGWRFGDVADFLELSEDEKVAVDAALKDARENGTVSWDEVKQELGLGKVIRFSDRDRDRFLEALDRHPEPNEALLKATERYRGRNPDDSRGT